MSFLLIIYSCKKEKEELIDQEPILNNLDPPLPPEFDAWISSRPSIDIPMEELTLDNGLNVYQFLTQNDPTFLNNLSSGKLAPNGQKSGLSEEMQYNLLISRMVAVGNYLVSPTDHVYQAGSNATLEPAQNKLVYSYGSKQHYQRAFPTSGSCKTVHKIHGLDCSGMLYEMTNIAGLSQILPADQFGCVNLIDVNLWNAAFAVSDEFQDLMLIELGNISPKKRKSGDIVFYRKDVHKDSVFHVGVVLKNNGDNKNYVYQSNGSPSQCAGNLSKGPKLMEDDYTHGAINRVYRIVKSGDVVKDVDGNHYQTIQIGTQRWFQEDLKTKRFRNGQSISNVKETNAWITAQTPAYCSYENEAGNDKLFGLLYNWYTVADPRGLCPLGYHVSTDDDWLLLENTLGMNLDDLFLMSYRGEAEDVGNKLKFEAEWLPSGTTNINSSAFNALPSGARSGFDGIFGGRFNLGMWWTSDQNAVVETDAFYRELYYNNSGINRNIYSKEHGFSVRCVKD